MALSINDIHVFLGDSYVLQGVSLGLPDKRVAAILGSNGVGKTTLLRAIVGLTEPPRTGSISWDGTDMAALPAWRRARLGLGYVPQGRHVFPSLTVEENILVASQAGARAVKPWTLSRLYELFPVLRERRGQPATALSGGEQQMLAIARALAGNPRTILLDEPTEGLAPIMVERVHAALAAIREAGHGVILVEQNHRFAAALADEIHVMRSGKIVYSGAADGALDEIVERYLGV